MNITQVMISSLFFTFCICVATSTDVTVTRNLDKKTLDVFRQMLNQETIIRLTFTKTIDDMKKDVLKQKQIIASLQTDVKNMKTESDLLRQENKLQKEQLSQQHSSISKLNNTTQTLNGHIENILENVSDITNNLKSFAKEITHIARELGNRTSMDALKKYLSDEVDGAMKDMNVNILQTQNQQLRLANDIAALKLFRMNVSNSIIDGPRKTVAFHARLKNSMSNIGSYKTVKFGTVTLNKGGAYDSSTGMFTAPRDGVYSFDWTILSCPNKKEFHTELVKDNKIIAYNFCHNGVSGYFLACSHAAVVEMKSGNKVWIRTHSNGACANSNWSSFSGFSL